MGSCNRAGILMKNSNNIKWGVSTADTLLLRALQTDRVTRYTHYAATVQPLSVMMMAALTGAAFKNPSPANTLLQWGVKAKKEKKKKGGVRSRCVQACLFPSDLPADDCHWSSGFPATPSLLPVPTASLHFQWPLHRESHSWEMQIKISALMDSNCPPAQHSAVIPPDRRALEPGLRFSHPSVIPHLKEQEKETAHINMWTSLHTRGRHAWEKNESTLLLHVFMKKSGSKCVSA